MTDDALIQVLLRLESKLDVIDKKVTIILGVVLGAAVPTRHHARPA